MEGAKFMNIFITGASRGIGLEFTKQFLQAGHHVWAACRNPDGARDLWELQRDYRDQLYPVKLDVNDQDLNASLKGVYLPEYLDLLLNNAGILVGEAQTFETLKEADLAKSFATNTIGPMKVTQVMLPLLKKSNRPKVAHISSLMGSIADNKGGGYYAYRMSKTALNMFNRSFATDHKTITSVVLHPGWVKTAMGGEQAPVEPYDSVKGLINVVENLTLDSSGRFFDYQGKELPW
jgi:NAD(P)-dependent dehydrogenase (short-subunit alcohol dehydrogenase family)